MNRKFHARTFVSILALLAAPTLLAQTPPEKPANTTSQATGNTTFNTRNGTIVTVRSHHPEAAASQPAPSFAELDTDGNGSIDTSEVNAYPPLANDFKYADSNHDSAISKAEYKHWTGQP